jgi:hypothetical protein
MILCPGKRVKSIATGKVLMAGGFNYQAGAFASAELYDPDTGTFTATGMMTRGHSGHTATLLSSGRVLLSGGATYGNGGTLVTVEIYDPVSGRFSLARSMTTPRVGHEATQFADGSVLVTGGVR